MYVIIYMLNHICAVIIYVKSYTCSHILVVICRIIYQQSYSDSHMLDHIRDDHIPGVIYL